MKVLPWMVIGGADQNAGNPCPSGGVGGGGDVGEAGAAGVVAEAGATGGVGEVGAVGGIDEAGAAGGLGEVGAAGEISRSVCGPGAVNRRVARGGGAVGAIRR